MHVQICLLDGCKSWSLPVKAIWSVGWNLMELTREREKNWLKSYWWWRRISCWQMMVDLILDGPDIWGGTFPSRCSTASRCDLAGRTHTHTRNTSVKDAQGETRIWNCLKTLKWKKRFGLNPRFSAEGGDKKQCCGWRGTCRRRPQQHRLRPADAQVPDAVSVSRVLPEQLARGSGRGGLEAGHDLPAEGKPCHRLSLAASHTVSRCRRQSESVCEGTLVLQEGKRVSRAGELLVGGPWSRTTKLWISQSALLSKEKHEPFNSSTRVIHQHCRAVL